MELNFYVLDRLVSDVSGSGGGDAGSQIDKNSNSCRCIPKLERIHRPPPSSL